MLEIVTSVSHDDDSYGVLTIVDVTMTVVGVIMMILRRCGDNSCGGRGLSVVTVSPVK